MYVPYVIPIMSNLDYLLFCPFWELRKRREEGSCAGLHWITYANSFDCQDLTKIEITINNCFTSHLTIARYQYMCILHQSYNFGIHIPISPHSTYFTRLYLFVHICLIYLIIYSKFENKSQISFIWIPLYHIIVIV